MRRLLGLAAIGCALLAPQDGSAHLGNVVAVARFSTPAPPPVTPSDMGDVLAPFSFTTVTAGQAYTVSWNDGDNDPTSRFNFYYMDHLLPFAADWSMVEMLGTPIPNAQGIWASCTCNPDAGVICPDSGVRSCPNSFDWDTTGLAPGAYWIYAVTEDYSNTGVALNVYSYAQTPVVVQAAGGPAPPAAMVLRPDGYGAFDQSYRVQWYAAGTPPLKIDLAYGVASSSQVLGPTTPLATDVQSIQNPDGTQSWDWDISKLDSLGVYFLRVTVTDGNGVQTFTESHFGLTVFHPATDGGMPDLYQGGSPRPDGSLVLKPASGGCDVAPTAGGWLVLGPLALLLVAVVVWLWARRS